MRKFRSPSQVLREGWEEHVGRLAQEAEITDTDSILGALISTRGLDKDKGHRKAPPFSRDPWELKEISHY